MVSLLQLCKTPTKRTKIVYQMNMNNVTAKNLRDEAEKKGLLERIEDAEVITYKTSKKGLKLLVKWKEICDLYEDENLPTNELKPWPS